MSYISDLKKALIPKIKYKQEGKNILLFATRRGGSSILSQVLSSNPIIREIDQPFDLFKSKTKTDKIKLKHLPTKELSQFIELDKKGQKQFIKYFHSITNGRKFDLQPYYSLKNKTLLKIVNANTLSDLLISLNQDKAIYLFRHPCPQALSVIQNNWGFTSEAYFNTDWINKRFDNDIIKELKSISTKGSRLQQGIVNWGFENIHLLKFSQSQHLKIYYEELVMHPEVVLPKIHNYCELQYDNKKEKIFNKPSRSSQYSNADSVEAIKKGNNSFLINKWLDKVTESEQKDIQHVLDLFNIDEYSANSIYPKVNFNQ